MIVDQIRSLNFEIKLPYREIKMGQFEATWERITDEDDPRRCQHIMPTKGQCRLVAVENSTFCPAHGGNKAFEAAKKTDLRNYRLSKFRAKISRLGNSEEIISLRDEIGILRLLVEEKINQCDGVDELLLMSGPLSDLMMKVEKVVTSCNRLENKLGNLLDRTKVLQFAQTIVQIIGNYITDEEALETIGEEILTALKDISTP